MGNNRELNLYMLTTSFPYENAENWLETEILYLEKHFKITLVPSRMSKHSRFTTPNVIVKNDFSRLYKPRGLRCLLNFEFSYNILPEIKFSWNIRYNWIQLSWLLMAAKYYKYFDNLLKKELLNKEVIFYSQWFTGTVAALALLKKKYPSIKIITKCHRGDLYEESQGIVSYPFRNLSLQFLDRVCAISKHGKNHLTKRYKNFESKISFIRLGTSADYNTMALNLGENKKKVKIVSCSSLTSVKRVNLIIDILKHFNKSEYQIEWHHFGDGKLMPEIQTYANNHLNKENISFCFWGSLSNKEVKDFYSKNYCDLFINVSSSEGIPVSIMEAQAAGIPVIATNVGGTSEIVNEENGILIHKNFHPQDVYLSLLKILNQPNILLSKRKASRLNWEQSYNANKNCVRFIYELKRL